MMLLYLKWHKLVKSVCYGLVGVLCNFLNTLLCQVWNVADGRELAVCSKHDGWVSSCWFSSDSDFLVSVSNNIKVRVYIFFTGIFIRLSLVVCLHSIFPNLSWVLQSFQEKSKTIETFSISFFRGWCKLQTWRCHVTMVLRSRLQFAVHVWRREGLLAVSEARFFGTASYFKGGNRFLHPPVMC